MGRTTPII